MPLSPSDRARLIATEQRVRAEIRDRLVAYATTMWGGMGSWRDDDVERFVARITPAVLAGRTQVAALTDAYVARLTGEGAAGVIDVTTLRGGVPVADVYRRPATTLYTGLSKGVTFDAAQSAAIARLTDIVRTDLQLAMSNQAHRTTSRARNVKAFARTLTGAENCALCVIASTQRYWKRNLLPIHPGCVSGDSVVSATGLRAISRRWYTGKLAVITTASGDEVSVTANHPVLTESGWVPAHLLSVGDDMLRGRAGHGVVDGVPNEAQGPSRIEDLWRSASMLGLLVRMPLAAEDFHADSAHGEVEIVAMDSHLATPGDAHVREPFGEPTFGLTHGRRILLPTERDLHALGIGVDTPASGLMGGGDLGSPLGSGHAGCPEHSSGATAPRFDAPAGEFTPQSAPIYASQGMSLKRRLAGQVEPDRIVDLRWVSWSDHVYNLHTDEGWYSSNNHIVSNCDCGVVSLGKGEHFEQTINPDLLESTHKQVASFTGEASDSGARELGLGKETAKGKPVADYTDLIITRNHGEYGPTLTWRHQKFTGPADI